MYVELSKYYIIGKKESTDIQDRRKKVEVTALVVNIKAVEENAENNRSGIFRLPLVEDEIKEKLGFDSEMTGWWVSVYDSPLEELSSDTTLEEINELYYMLETLEGKIHEDDIKAVRKKWFSSLKEMCDNSSFVEWIQGNSVEEAAQRELENYAGTVPEKILKCVDISKYVPEVFADEECYLVTAHGVYSFEKPVY